MKQYNDLIKHILENGNERPDRTGTGTISVFGYQMRFDLSKGFPLLTTKKVNFASIVKELLWFLSGSTNEKDLSSQGCNIWKEWALTVDNLTYNIQERWTVFKRTNPEKYNEYKKQCEERGLATADETTPPSAYKPEELERFHAFFDRQDVPRVLTEYIGQLGPIYGHQWRNAGSPGHEVDQIQTLINGLRTNPFSRRHIVSTWSPSDLPDETMSPQTNVLYARMALAPCHVLFQFYAENLSFYERLDIAVGKELISTKEFKDYKTMTEGEIALYLDQRMVPKYKLSCQLYQRSY